MQAPDHILNSAVLWPWLVPQRIQAYYVLKLYLVNRHSSQTQALEGVLWETLTCTSSGQPQLEQVPPPGNLMQLQSPGHRYNDALNIWLLSLKASTKRTVKTWGVGHMCGRIVSQTVVLCREVGHCLPAHQ
jgi:hypothetical protein